MGRQKSLGSDTFSEKEDKFFAHFENVSGQNKTIHSHYTNVDGVGPAYVAVKRTGTVFNPLDITVGFISNRDMPNGMKTGDCAKFVISMDDTGSKIRDYRENEIIEGSPLPNSSNKLGNRGEQIGFIQDKLKNFIASEAYKAGRLGTQDGKETSDVLQRFLHAKPEVIILDGKPEVSQIDLKRLGGMGKKE